MLIDLHLKDVGPATELPTLLDVMEALTGDQTVPVQLITVTHSPLVLASTEPHFDPDTDAIFTLDLDARHTVTLEEYDWKRRGSADAWLTSPIFDLEDTGSIPAEEARALALAVLRQDNPDPAQIEEADRKLRATLSSTDRFWLRWAAWRDERLPTPLERESPLVAREIIRAGRLRPADAERRRPPAEDP